MRVQTILTYLVWATSVVHSFSSGYYDAFEALVPYKFKTELHTAANPNELVVESQESPYLYAGRYATVEELCEVLFDDLDELRKFNVNQPHVYYSDQEYEEAMNMPVYALTEQLVSRAWITLFRIYSKYIRIFETLEKLSEKDYVDIFDHITGKDTENYFAPAPYYGEGEDFDIGAMGKEELAVSIQEILLMAYEETGVMNEAHTITYAEVPFICDEDSTGFVKMEIPYDPLDNGTDKVSTQGLSILKIPLLIIKLILIVIWDLIELKKLIELAEVKSVLLILKLLKKICNIISFIKSQIVFELRVIIWTIKTKKPLYKTIAVLFLILKKLRQLAWVLNDLLYRYRWKIYFVIRRVEKKSLALAYYLKVEVYGKLGIPTKEEKLYKPWVEKNDEYFDGDYFKTFARYTYWNGETKARPYGKKSLQDLKENLGDYGGEIDLDDDFLNDGDGVDGEGDIMFDMKEQYGFDSVKLDIKKLEKGAKKGDTKKYRWPKY